MAGNYTINTGACQKCGQCVSHCPHGAIKKIGMDYWIDHMLCNGCGACKTACPHYAISYTPDDQSNMGQTNMYGNV